MFSLETIVNQLTVFLDLAGLAALASILAFLLRERKERTASESSGVNRSDRLILRVWNWLVIFWSDLIFIILLLITVIVFVNACNRSQSLVDAQNHRFINILTEEGQEISVASSATVRAYSNATPFKLVVKGQFSVGQMEKIQRAYTQNDDVFNINEPNVPMYILVTARPSINEPNFWWAHPGALDLRANGFYEITFALGGDEAYAAQTGDLFGIMAYIPQDPNEEIRTKGDRYALEDLPQELFLSEELPIRTFRYIER